MGIFLLIVIAVASVLLVLFVLAQNPKSGGGAQFGGGANMMGVQKTTDLLEKLTWGFALGIIVLSVVANKVLLSDVTNSAAKSKIETIKKAGGDQDLNEIETIEDEELED